jgi:cyclophilin family peptidyl-prolyl cis-trans isomerase
MWILLMPMLMQAPTERAAMEADHARAAGAASTLAALRSPDSRVQRLALRGIGRLEDTTHRDAVLPMFRAADPMVRREAAGALAQMRASYDFAPLLSAERDALVRAAIYEAIGRARPASSAAESVLVAGIASGDLRARRGAARGLESLIRLGARTRTLSASSLAVAQRAYGEITDAEFRQLVLLAARRGVTSLRETFPQSVSDTSALVRAIGAPTLTDTSAMVRIAALRVSTSCTDLVTAAHGPNEAVALVALDAMRELKGCTAAPILDLSARAMPWRIRTAALGAISVLDASRAAELIPTMIDDSVWQARAHVATAAQRIKDTLSLSRLARDANPNVALAAIWTVDDAVRALRSDHAGLVLTAAEFLKTRPAAVQQNLTRVMGSYRRLSGEGSMTLRDPRVALLACLGTVRDTTVTAILVDALGDRDPAIARAAAAAMSAVSGRTVMPTTTLLPIPPLPSASYVAALRGAQARIVMRGLGTIVVDLLTDDAPVTVATFAQTAEAGQYNGLTFHRIVPNFVIQGGSPGADEYDGRTREFMRDEVGFARNARGTIGISTRGRDTGDGQIYFNLIDNFRLDRDYTVLARMRTGFDVMDRVAEGDVIERIEIIRADRARSSSRSR